MPIYFDYKKAKADGVSDEEIAAYLDAQRAQGVDIGIRASDLGAEAPQAQPSTGKRILNAVTKGPQDLNRGFLKGVVSTVQGASELGQRFLNAVTPDAIAQPRKIVAVPENMTKPKNLGENIGFGAERVAEFLVPSSKVVQGTKAAEAAVMGSRLARSGQAGRAVASIGRFAVRPVVEGAVVGGQTALQEGELNDNVKNAAAFGAAAPVAGTVLRLGGKVANTVVKQLASRMSGVPLDAIDQAIKNPTVVRQTIRTAAKEGEEAPMRIYRQAKDALGELKSARSAAYEEVLATVPQQVDGLTVDAVRNAAKRAMRKIGLTTKGKTLDLSRRPSLDGTNLQKLNDLVNSWDDVTPLGMNQLDQEVRGFLKGGVNLGPADKRFNLIVNRVRDSIKAQLEKHVPEVAGMNREYAAASRVIDDIERQLSLKNQNPQAALRKLVNVLNPRSEIYRPVVRELGERAGVDLMSEIAGLLMSKWTPSGLSSYFGPLLGGASLGGAVFGNPGSIAALPAVIAGSSPRIVGAAATAAGRAESAFKSLPSFFKAPSRRLLGN